MMAGLVDLTINMREGLDYTVSEIQLTEASLNEAADAAIKAFDGAQNLDELAALRRDHLGDAAPIPQARRSLGTIPKDQRKDAGRFVNMALGRAEKHFAQVKVVLEEKRNAEVLGWCAAPHHDPQRADRRHLRGHGLGNRRGPRGGSRILQLRRTELPA